MWATLLTHQGVDHAGGLADVVDRADPVVIAHRECAPYVDGRMEPIKMDDRRYPSVPVDITLTEGDRFSTVAGPMELLHTPGHAPGHLSLYFEEERLLVSGDALARAGGSTRGPARTARRSGGDRLDSKAVSPRHRADAVLSLNSERIPS